MKDTFVRAAALMLTATSTIAWAGPTTTVSFHGTVSQVLNAAQAPGISVGDVVTFSASFDPAKSVDISQTFYNIDAKTRQPVSVPGLRSISLSDDRSASYTISIGTGHTFTQASDYDFGQDFGFGAGNFPLVLYAGQQLLGLDGGSVAADGLVLDFDPIAFLLHYRSSVGLGYANENATSASFRVTTELDGAIRSAVVTAVPEPGSWALMAAGLGGLGWWSRRCRVAGGVALVARPG